MIVNDIHCDSHSTFVNLLKPSADKSPGWVDLGSLPFMPRTAARSQIGYAGGIANSQKFRSQATKSIRWDFVSVDDSQLLSQRPLLVRKVREECLILIIFATADFKSRVDVILEFC